MSQSRFSRPSFQPVCLRPNLCGGYCRNPALAGLRFNYSCICIQNKTTGSRNPALAGLRFNSSCEFVKRIICQRRNPALAGLRFNFSVLQTIKIQHVLECRNPALAGLRFNVALNGRMPIWLAVHLVAIPL